MAFSRRASSCFMCGKNPPKNGDALCESCTIEYTLCYECGEKERNHPFKLCTNCYQKQSNNSISRSEGRKNICIEKLDSGKSEFKQAHKQFVSSWVKNPPSPEPLAIFAIHNKSIFDKFNKYVKKQKENDSDSTTSYHFHGTVLLCDILQTNELCRDTKCGICGIGRSGFSPSFIGSNIPDFMRFGEGFYLAANSSKCHDYTRGVDGHDVRAQLLCSVASGTRFATRENQKRLMEPPQDCDSVHGIPGSALNYEEIVVYDRDAVLPEFIIVYEKDGVHKIAK